MNHKAEMTLLTEATLYRDAADVKRYHTRRVTREQSVGAHSFNMLMLVNMVAPDARKEVFVAIMHHDLPELMTGDIPAPIKRMHDMLGPIMDQLESELAPLYRDCGLTSEEEHLVKWADRMELVLWCLEEFRLGNRYCAETAERGLTWILEARKGDNAYCGPFSTTDHLTTEVVNEFITLGLKVAVRPINERENRVCSKQTTSR
jgi:5'-deoxynucleotidase YfbR-like HD superfamily hydrolase